MDYYQMTVEDTAVKLATDPKTGLTNNEALKRLAETGENKLTGQKTKSLFIRFLGQFKDVMILILMAAAAASFFIAFMEGNAKNFIEPVLILLIVIFNAIMGVMQENKAEKALEALKKLSTPRCRVLRDGHEEIINSAHLVPGDIIFVEAGDYIPADSRILSCSLAKCDESALTGESLPAEKNASPISEENIPVGDRTNMLYSGCSLTYGRASAVVCATGMDTEMGRIAGLLTPDTPSRTPLSVRLSRLGKTLGFLALCACLVIFFIGMQNGIPALEIFMTSISLAVSAIPEGLPAIVTIVLSLGVERMAKKNAVIRHLPAVETLGSASVICSDKTGTLTQNRMTLMKTYTEAGKNIEAVTAHASADMQKLLQYASLCCNGTVSTVKNSTVHIGDPTETAIVFAAQKCGLVKEKLNEKYPRLLELPFDSERKRMTTVCRIEDENVVIVKGAFDIIENLCSEGDMKAAREANKKMSSTALRVLAVAYKTVDEVSEDTPADELECRLHFLGLLGMMDPPRPEALKAVALCKKAGIRPIMITGDHIITACAVAKELGILTGEQKAVTGKELDTLSDARLAEALEQYSVYARVSPEHKIRIVKAWQAKGHVVAMTGDGVNDAPALKTADIGCAMGITGTQVAKNASDMTLTDDNFATIVEAVREGRGIYANIKKVVAFLIGTNIGEVITVFAAMFLWHKTPLLSIHLLWMNLVTDSLPAISLGLEPIEAAVMNEQPKPRSEGIFAHGLGIQVILQGILFGLLALTAFVMGEKQTGTLEGARTMAFMVLSLSQIVQSYNMRSGKSLFAIGPFTNKSLNISAGISVLLIALILLTPVNGLFGLVFLSSRLYLTALGLIFIPFIVMELAKYMRLIR
ncbi:MAG: cation-translocating P-type ATPase [Alistipes sp.]|nr:cation-translocating P-type ATPase [Alistipes sp.]